MGRSGKRGFGCDRCAQDNLLTLLGNPLNWAWPEYAVVAGALGLLLALWLRSSRVKVSRLLQPDALWRDPRAPEQLIGRADDLRRLLDWSDGPLRALREDFTRALPPDDPARNARDNTSPPERYAEVFAAYDKRTSRPPLLLLDQFDDFEAQARHRDRFCPPDTRIRRKADQVTAENRFWQVLRAGIESDTLRIVVAVRAEATPGLDCIRLCPDPPSFDLPRLPSDLAQRIIADMTERPEGEKPVIAFPDRGWTALRDRLAGDLHSRGLILPQQLKVALGGLRSLPRQTSPLRQAARDSRSLTPNGTGRSLDINGPVGRSGLVARSSRKPDTQQFQMPVLNRRPD